MDTRPAIQVRWDQFAWYNFCQLQTRIPTYAQKHARCLITWHRHLLGKSWTVSIGPRLLSTILASGTWDFNVSLWFLTIILITAFASPFYLFTSVSGISSDNHLRHLRLWLSDTSQGKRFNIMQTTHNLPLLSSGNPWVFCKLPRHRNTLGFDQMPNSLVA